MSTSDELDEVHGLLLHLCEQDLSWSDEAQLCVMDAFNDLSDLNAPTRAVRPLTSDAGERVRRALSLLSGLIQSSRQLDRTLALLQVRGLITQALAESP